MIQYPLLETGIRAIRTLGFTPRDLGLLDSALKRPQSRLFGEDAYPSLPLKAAALLDSVTNYMCLIDGNKRLAWVLANFFMAANGKEIRTTQEEGYEFIMSIAEKRLELEDIAAWLEDHMIPLIP